MNHAQDYLLFARYLLDVRFRKLYGVILGLYRDDLECLALDGFLGAGGHVCHLSRGNISCRLSMLDTENQTCS